MRKIVKLFNLPLTVYTAMLLSAGPAYAQQNVLEISDWKIACLDARLCEMKSEIISGGAVAARIGVLNYRGQFLFQYTIPLGIDLEQSVFLRIDDEPLISTAVVNCSGLGCTGFVALDTNMIQNMKRGDDISILFSSSVSNDPFAITFSLSGFTASFAEIING